MKIKSEWCKFNFETLKTVFLRIFASDDTAV